MEPLNTKKMKTISKKRALDLSAAWHGGQWSCLYEFCSTGNIRIEFSLWLIEEIIREQIRPEISLKPFIRSKKDSKELTQLLNYFLKYFKEKGVNIYIGKDFYGLPMPKLQSTLLNVRSLTRLQ